MGLSKNTPVFLDENSGFTKQQIDTINLIARTTRKNFENKARQTQLGRNKIEKVITTSYPTIIADLKNYLYGKNFCIEFITISQENNYQAGDLIPLFESNYLLEVNLSGGNPDGQYSVSSYCQLIIRRKADGYVYSFYILQPFPQNNGRDIQFTVYMNGVIQ